MFSWLKITLKYLYLLFENITSNIYIFFLFELLSLVIFQDKDDDLKVGVKSTALRFGDSTKEWISGFGVASIISLALSGYNADIGNYFLHL